MKAKEYLLLERCVEDGILRGINRAHKHLIDDEFPSREELEMHIQQAIMLEISEWFDFEELKYE